MSRQVKIKLSELNAWLLQFQKTKSHERIGQSFCNTFNIHNSYLSHSTERDSMLVGFIYANYLQEDGDGDMSNSLEEKVKYNAALLDMIDLTNYLGKYVAFDKGMLLFAETYDEAIKKGNVQFGSDSGFVVRKVEVDIPHLSDLVIFEDQIDS